MHTRTLSRLFHLSMWWRIIYGCVRIILGLLLLKMINVPFSEIFCAIMNYEVTAEPTDHVISYINTFLEDQELTVTMFVAAYLLFWGVLDVILSICLLRHQWWAFPVSLFLIGTFILYESYRFTYTLSPFLLTVIIIDALIFWIIWREYVDIEKKAHAALIRTKTASLVSGEAVSAEQVTETHSDANQEIHPERR